MTFQDKIIAEFDSKRRIVHLTAESEIRFNEPEDLLILYKDACEILERYTGDGPVYLLVDLARFIVDPSLFGFYAEKSAKLKEKFLYPEGMAGYGFQITRVTVQLSYGDCDKRPPLFKTRREAEEYLENLASIRQSISS